MRFLTRVWMPFWIYFIVIHFSHVLDHTGTGAAIARGVFYFWLGLNVFLTGLYIGVRGEQRSSRGILPPH
jgi:hypothetical protein